MNIPYFKPSLSEGCLEAVKKVLQSHWLTTGPVTLEFEKAFAKYVGSRYAVMLNSCTAALHLSLKAINLNPNDEVITTPYTFAASAEVIEYFNARPVFVDIRPDTLNIDEKKIEEKITKKTRAILPVHFAGHPCEMDTIKKIAKKYELKIIEDAAHCTPAFYKEKAIGTLSDCTCFSFYANKCITTGEGGMLTTDNQEIYESVLSLRLHGMSKDAINRYNTKGSWNYSISQIGYKYNPTDTSAAMGLSQLAEADSFLKKREEIATRYTHNLKNNPHIQINQPLEHVHSSRHLFPIQLKGQLIKKRDQIIEFLKQKGIGTSVHFIPLHIQPYYQKKYSYQPQDFPIAFKTFERSISLPIYPSLTSEEVDYICQILNEITL